MEQILLVEDEKDLRFSLTHNLEFEGYSVVDAEDGNRGWDLFQDTQFSLIILDIMVPGMDGLALLQKIREFNATVPVMMLTAKATEMDKVIGFRLGADDYLTKPFALGEFLARVKALLRRNRLSQVSGTCIRFFKFEMDFDNYTVRKNKREISFTQKEFLLLKYLILRPNQAIEKSKILDDVWDYKSDATSRTIDTHMARIRRKLDDQHPYRIIQTVPTVGYKFIAPIEQC